MNRVRQTIVLLAVLLAGGSRSASLAQVGTNGSGVSPSNGVPSALMPPMPPPAKSPVALFRELLAASPDEQRRLLAQRPQRSQELIRQKLSEYKKLSPEERQLRLQVTELRFYLSPLLNLAPTNRPALAFFPASMTNLLTARLVIWDQVPPEQQREFLENEATVRYIIELATCPLGQQAETLKTLPDAQRQQLDKWQKLSDEQRQRILQLFGQMFNLTAGEEKETLEELTPAEKEQIDKTLKTFGTLSYRQRGQVLLSFQKFKGFSPEERRRFIEDAAHWKLMTPTERQLWKDVVYSISRQPPLPPGLGEPPLPPKPPRRASGTLIATNAPP